MINIDNSYKVLLAALIIVPIVALVLKKSNLKELNVGFKFLGFEFKTKATYNTRKK